VVSFPLAFLLITYTRSSGVPTNNLYTFLFSAICAMSRPPHPPRLRTLSCGTILTTTFVGHHLNVFSCAGCSKNRVHTVRVPGDLRLRPSNFDVMASHSRLAPQNLHKTREVANTLHTTNGSRVDVTLTAHIMLIFEAFTAVILKEAVIWHVTQCGSCKKLIFGGTYRLHHQGDKNRRLRIKVSSN
jgi:hypothetical protein